MIRVKNVAILLLMNILFLTVFLFLLESYLFWSDKERKLPFNGWYQGTKLYTWGIPVQFNSLGFRDDEPVIPKPPGVTRVLVLGDSLTFGVGLELEQRFTNMTERSLSERYPSRNFDVVNLGQRGGPTVEEYNILERVGDRLNPDLIVVAYCVNDPQRKGQDWTPEREAFLGRTKNFRSDLLDLKHVGLKYLGKRLEKAYIWYAEKTGTIPTVDEAMERAYNTTSEDWIEFQKALQNIKKYSDDRNLPPPIFASLNQGISQKYPTDYSNPTPDLKTMLNRLHQAESEARRDGYTVYNHEQAIISQLGPRVMVINAVDGHPSADLNVVYATELTRVVSEYIDSGSL